MQTCTDTLHPPGKNPSLGGDLVQVGATWRGSTAGFGPDIGVVQKQAISLRGGSGSFSISPTSGSPGLSRPVQEYESRLCSWSGQSLATSPPASNLGGDWGSGGLSKKNVYKKKPTIPD